MDNEFDKEGDDVIAAQQQAKRENATGDMMPGEKDKDAAKSDGDEEIWDTQEDPTRAYRFINLRFRDVVVPKFMLNIFADGGRTVNVFTFGPELSIRKDRLEYDFAFSYADYSMDPFLFKGKSDGDQGTYTLTATDIGKVTAFDNGSGTGPDCGTDLSAPDSYVAFNVAMAALLSITIPAMTGTFSLSTCSMKAANLSGS